MASSRRRGAHAAARGHASFFVAAKRAPSGAGGRRAATRSSSGGRKVDGEVRPRSRRPKVAVAVAAVVVLVGGFAHGFRSHPSPEPTVQAFLLAWEQHHYRAAADLTTGEPAAVASALRTAYQQLDAAAFHFTMKPITRHGDVARARFRASVDLGQDGAPWTYQGRFDLRKTGGSWKVAWRPSVINPHLRPGLRLAVATTTPPRAPVLDAAGKPLQTPSTAYVAGVTPGSLASPARTAGALATAAHLDAGQVLGVIRSAPRSSFLPLLTLPPASYAKIRGALARVPGLSVRPRQLSLFTSKAGEVVGAVGSAASQALRDQGVAYHPGATVGLSGLERVYQRRLAGAATTEVIVEDASGHQVAVLNRSPEHPPKPVRTTIDAGVQSAAEQALAGLRSSAAIVAVQASTGRILAVSGHSAPGLPSVDPLHGAYAPGQAFTIVSTAALLSTGLQVGTAIPCTSPNDVGGRTFANVPSVGPPGATATFGADFANACATAFATLSRRLRPGDLASAAEAFGLGVPWKRMPLPSFSGALTTPGNVADRASDTIGQGTVKVSPLAMAMVAAQVDAGAPQSPSLVVSPPRAGRAPARKAKLSPGAITTLRALMRQAARSGAAAPLDSLGGPPAAGQVGQAPAGIGANGLQASWFVGYRGDIAVAVLELSKSARTSAVPAAAAFLSHLPSG